MFHSLIIIYNQELARFFANYHFFKKTFLNTTVFIPCSVECLLVIRIFTNSPTLFSILHEMNKYIFCQ